MTPTQITNLRDEIAHNTLDQARNILMTPELALSVAEHGGCVYTMSVGGVFNDPDVDPRGHVVVIVMSKDDDDRDPLVITGRVHNYLARPDYRDPEGVKGYVDIQFTNGTPIRVPFTTIVHVYTNDPDPLS